MFNILFPIGEYWDWNTFLLYVSISICVCVLCRWGAEYKHDINIKQPKRAISINKGTILYFFAFVILTTLATIRSPEVGSDTLVYVGYFHNFDTINFSWGDLLKFQQMEPGFQLYLMLIRNITNNYHIFFLVAYSFVSAMYIKYIKFFYDKDSNYLFLIIFIFFYTSNMSGMRAAIATGFLLQSFIFLSQKKYIKSAFLTLIACAFHYTMMFNFVLLFMTYLMERKELFQKKWILPVGLTLSFVFSFAMTNVLKSILASTKYEYYASVSLEDLSILGSVFYLFYAILAFIFYKDISLKCKTKNKIKNIFLLTINFLLTYPAIYVTAAYRIPNYYAMPRLTIWSEFTNIAERRYFKHDKLLFRVVIFIIVILYLLFKYTRAAENGHFAYIIG